MLAKAFDSVEAASQSGGLSPIQFSTLWRSLSGGRQNLFAEMKMFHKFNTSGNSVVDFEASKAKQSKANQSIRQSYFCLFCAILSVKASAVLFYVLFAVSLLYYLYLVSRQNQAPELQTSLVLFARQKR